jgi:hypothetical protein
VWEIKYKGVFIMGKKVKSLLVAGLLVLGMGRNVFANDVYTSVVENPRIEEGVNQRTVTLQDGNIVLDITKNEDGSYYIVTSWNASKVKVVNVKTYYANGYEIISETQFRDDENCNTIIKDGDNYKVNLSDMIKSDLVKVEVNFEPVKSDEPVVPPTEPEEPEQPPVDPEIPEEPVIPPTEPEIPEENVTDPEPETGDGGLLVYIGMASASVAGLYLLNRKKDEKTFCFYILRYSAFAGNGAEYARCKWYRV